MCDDPDLEVLLAKLQLEIDALGEVLPDLTDEQLAAAEAEILSAEMDLFPERFT